MIAESTCKKFKELILQIEHDIQNVDPKTQILYGTNIRLCREFANSEFSTGVLYINTKELGLVQVMEFDAHVDCKNGIYYDSLYSFEVAKRSDNNVYEIFHHLDNSIFVDIPDYNFEDEFESSCFQGLMDFKGTNLEYDFFILGSYVRPHIKYWFDIKPDVISFDDGISDILIELLHDNIVNKD